MDMISVTAPTSKSLSHRALIAAALARGESEVEHLLESVDIEITRRSLEAAGAEFAHQETLLGVSGFENGPVGGGAGGDASGKGDPVDIYVHESGTSCRLLTAVLAAGNGTFRVRGAERMDERPIGELAQALEAQGAKFTWEGKVGCTPFILKASGLSGGSVDISLEESSQYLSGLLLAAPLARKTVTINLVGSKALSWPYVALTLQIMEDFKASVSVAVKGDKGWEMVPWRSLKAAEPGKLRFVIMPSEYEFSNYRVEGDWSNGSYLLASGAVGPRPVRVNGLRADSHQGDRAIIDILAAMGAKVQTDFTGVTVSPGALKGIAVDMSRSPDIVPTVAVVAAFAEGETVISGVPHLRIKECDRIDAMATQLRKAGCEVEDLADGLRIVGGLGKGETVHLTTFGDHRIAMSLSLLQFAGFNTVFDDPECVSKSYPEFWVDWAEIRKGLEG